jgi:hypothetical protein
VLLALILAFGNFAEGVATNSAVLSLDPIHPAVPYPTPLNNESISETLRQINLAVQQNNNPIQILNYLAQVSRSNSQIPNSTDGQPPLQQPAPQQPSTEQTFLPLASSWDPENPPKQVCPEPRIMCWMPECRGQPDPPDPFRCQSKSITVVDSIATTLFACPCCPGGNWIRCDDEICDGEEEEKCKKEPVKGCHCRPRNPIYEGVFPIEHIYIQPAPRRWTTPIEPPPASGEFWNLSNESRKGAEGENVPWKHAASEILL